MLAKNAAKGHRKETGTLQIAVKIRKPAAGMATGPAGDGGIQDCQAGIALMR